MYNYQQSLKSEASDELINTYLLRPVAGLIVWVLYYTPVTPNQVTIASTIVGLIAAVLYAKGEPRSILIAGLLVTLKDVLDSADGQLARARKQYSRIGRFLDSIGDFVVDAAVFGAIGWTLFEQTDELWMIGLALLGFFGISLRVSYHVFYQASFLHLEEKYEVNRVSEEMTEQDRQGDRFILFLQQIFQFLYGWQDRLMLSVDMWCRKGGDDEEFRRRWYSDAVGLRLSGFLGFGTELFLLMLCSVFNQLELYLYLNLLLMNGIMVGCIVYRRVGSAARV